MTSLPPSRLLVHAAEQIHIIAASVQHFHVYVFPEPFGMLIAWLVILPLLSITIRWWAPVFQGLSLSVSTVAQGLYLISLWPAKANVRLVNMRKRMGSRVEKIGQCIGHWLSSDKSGD